MIKLLMSSRKKTNTIKSLKLKVLKEFLLISDLDDGKSKIKLEKCPY